MTHKKNSQSGFTLNELVIAMTIMLVLMGAAMTLLTQAFSTRTRETSKVDALVSARSAIDGMSREIGNSGYGLSSNGIVAADSNTQRLRIRANLDNTNLETNGDGEDVTYFFDNTTQSILRYNRNAGAGIPESTVIVNRISDVTFNYFDYVGSNSTPVSTPTPTANTGRVRITVTISLPDVAGQPRNQTVTLTSEVNLRNSTYMRYQY